MFFPQISMSPPDLFQPHLLNITKFYIQSDLGLLPQNVTLSHEYFYKLIDIVKKQLTLKLIQKCPRISTEWPNY